MASGYSANSVCHGDHRQPEGYGNSQGTHPGGDRTGHIPGKNSTSASHQNKDHCPDHFRYIPVHSISNYM
ncbi:hypothetical protein M103_0409 [Bacteroides fragilis str. 1007-1-F |nr:hypothetical protein M103_0409 [Bacteroides fragilis str. 1007-1-F \